MINIPYKSSKHGFYERARSTGHVPIIKNEFVQQKLKEFKIPSRKKINVLPKGLVRNFNKELDRQELPNYILSFDGSNQEVAIDENYPSTRIGYIQTATVLILLDKMLEEQKQSFVDPSKVKETIDKGLQATALPGANVCEPNCFDLRSSWRYDIFELFNEYEIEDKKILDVFWELLNYTGIKNPKNKRLYGNEVKLKSCSVKNKCKEEINVPKGGSICPKCKLPVYPTDILRIYEEVHENQHNDLPLNRLMLVLEHIYMIGYLDYLLKKRPEVLHKFAFIIDGPLAIMGPSAWLHLAIFNFINNKVYKTLKDKKMEFPLILGVSKSGHFVDNANKISKLLKPQEVMCPTENYMKNYILAAQPNEYHGKETYYGQYLFYKTKKSQIITLNIPRLIK
ncbi:MAG: hypothetical protein ACFFAO_06310 [Candidatus Hermodarchaeota archaeon]